jgi:hypothetical protein
MFIFQRQQPTLYAVETQSGLNNAKLPVKGLQECDFGFPNCKSHCFLEYGFQMILGVSECLKKCHSTINDESI